MTRHTALNHALSQARRARQTPAPASVAVDGRTLAEVLGFAAEYGALVRFYDLADQPDGDWSAFFRAAPSVGLALQAGLDLADIEAELDLLLRALRQADSAAPRLRHWTVLSRVVSRLSTVLQRDEAGYSDLGQALAGLAAAAHDAELSEPAQRLAYHLGYHLGPDQAEQRLRRASDSWLQQLCELIEALLAALLLALALLREAAIEALAPALRDQRHAPQAGLWAAFAQLFAHAQGSLNVFPRRLLAFYQNAVLRQDAAAAQPDHLVLLFTPEDGASDVPVPAGTQFPAGADAAGATVLYALDRGLAVQATTLAALRTVTLSTRPVAPGASPAPAQLFSASVRLSSQPPLIATPLPLFGDTNGAAPDGKASLGFAVASDCLMLAGGVRHVELRLDVSAASYAQLAPMLAAIGQQAGGMSAPMVLAQLLETGFTLRYSSTDGWVTVTSYQVTPPDDDQAAYRLSFRLDHDAAPCRAYLQPSQPAPGATGPYADTPTLQALLNQDMVSLSVPGSHRVAELYPYAVLSGLSLDGLALRVCVDGLAELGLSGPAGPLDGSAPFALFGSPPVQYAALRLSAPELFCKRLSSFALSIGWNGLPASSKGFDDYYQGYRIDADGKPVEPPAKLFSNTIFTAGVEVVNPGSWRLPTGAPYQSLFQTEDDGTTLLARTVLHLPVLAQSPGDYYDPASSAIELRLETPAYAFGDVLYAPNVMAASLQLTATAAACAAACGHPDQIEQERHGRIAQETPSTCVQECIAKANISFPNAPWLPMAQDARVSYSAHDNAPAFSHLCPFDEIVTPAWPPGQVVPLLAPVAGAGALYLELTPAPRSLSLFFELAPGAGGWSGGTPAPQWAQALDGGWQPCAPLEDSTGGLRQSGIVRLALAPSAGPLRLRIAVASEPSRFPLLAQVAPNAAGATWQAGGAERLSTPLAAGTITAPLAPLAGIGAVAQPLPSHGGRALLTGPDFDQWLAERLRHKDYALQAWDYASLVLAAFPTLWQAGVVAASDGHRDRAPGHVWIIAVPGPHVASGADATTPTSPAQTLDDIAAFLAPRVGPCVQLTVTNPPYTRLRVEAELRFNAGQAAEACIARLNRELIDFLSPWPPEASPARPDNYYTRQAVMNFVRQRPYVRAILSLKLCPEAGGSRAGRRYFTSALAHDLRGGAA